MKNISRSSLCHLGPAGSTSAWVRGGSESSFGRIKPVKNERRWNWDWVRKAFRWRSYIWKSKGGRKHHCLASVAWDGGDLQYPSSLSPTTPSITSFPTVSPSLLPNPVTQVPAHHCPPSAFPVTLMSSVPPGPGGNIVLCWVFWLPVIYVSAPGGRPETFNPFLLGLPGQFGYFSGSQFRLSLSPGFFYKPSSQQVCNTPWSVKHLSILWILN